MKAIFLFNNLITREVMKKILLLSFVLCSIFSCAKKEQEIVEEGEPIVFTVSIDESETKTTVDPTGKVNWVIGDEVIITGVSKSGNTYTKKYVVDAVGDHRKATLVPAPGTSGYSDTSYTYTANYGDVNNQVYNVTYPGSNCPMTASGSKPKYVSGKWTMEFNFTNACGVVAVSVGSSSESVSVSNITAIKVGGYALKFTTPTTIETGKEYLVAVKAGESFSKITFQKSDGKTKSKTIGSVSLNANVLKHLKTQKYFSGDYTDYELSGVFTAGDDGHQIQFMLGNLYWNGSGYTIEPNQFDFKSSYDANHVSHLYNYETTWGVKPYATSAYTMANKARTASQLDAAISGYRIPTQDEINYIIGNARKTSTLTKTHEVKTATISGTEFKYCAFFYPDNYSGTYNESTWDQLESAGVVFLPSPTGTRSGTTYSGTTIGYLTILSSGNTDFYCYNSGYDKCHTINTGGGIVRLVKDVSTTTE